VTPKLAALRTHGERSSAGTCEVISDPVAGLAVHIGARIAALAASGEVLLSSTVRDLVVGSGFPFAERGRHELKGVPGHGRCSPWRSRRRRSGRTSLRRLTPAALGLDQQSVQENADHVRFSLVAARRSLPEYPLGTLFRCT